jgi:hypothetical protein
MSELTPCNRFLHLWPLIETALRAFPSSPDQAQIGVN